MTSEDAMELYLNSHYIWPPEGHQTSHCHLAIYRDAGEDVVVVSDWGDHGEVDTSITHDLERLYSGIARQYFLGGPGRKVYWFEHYSRGWRREEPHPSGQPIDREIWSRVVFSLAPKIEPERRIARGPVPRVDRRRPRLFSNQVAAQWKPSSLKELEKLVGSCLAGKNQCAFQGVGEEEIPKAPPAKSETPKTQVETEVPQKPQTWKDYLKYTE
jgi:hypothetical protein